MLRLGLQRNSKSTNSTPLFARPFAPTTTTPPLAITTRHQQYATLAVSASSSPHLCYTVSNVPLATTVQRRFHTTSGSISSPNPPTSLPEAPSSDVTVTEQSIHEAITECLKRLSGGEEFVGVPIPKIASSLDDDILESPFLEEGLRAFVDRFPATYEVFRPQQQQSSGPMHIRLRSGGAVGGGGGGHNNNNKSKSSSSSSSSFPPSSPSATTSNNKSSTAGLSQKQRRLLQQQQRKQQQQQNAAAKTSSSTSAPPLAFSPPPPPAATSPAAASATAAPSSSSSISSTASQLTVFVDMAPQGVFDGTNSDVFPNEATRSSVLPWVPFVVDKLRMRGQGEEEEVTTMMGSSSGGGAYPTSSGYTTATLSSSPSSSVTAVDLADRFEVVLSASALLYPPAPLSLAVLGDKPPSAQAVSKGSSSSSTVAGATTTHHHANHGSIRRDGSGRVVCDSNMSSANRATLQVIFAAFELLAAVMKAGGGGGGGVQHHHHHTNSAAGDSGGGNYSSDDGVDPYEDLRRLTRLPQHHQQLDPNGGTAPPTSRNHLAFAANSDANKKLMLHLFLDPRGFITQHCLIPATTTVGANSWAVKCSSATTTANNNSGGRDSNSMFLDNPLVGTLITAINRAISLSKNRKSGPSQQHHHTRIAAGVDNNTTHQSAAVNDCIDELSATLRECVRFVAVPCDWQEQLLLVSSQAYSTMYVGSSNKNNTTNNVRTSSNSSSSYAANNTTTTSNSNGNLHTPASSSDNLHKNGNLDDPYDEYDFFCDGDKAVTYDYDEGGEGEISSDVACERNIKINSSNGEGGGIPILFNDELREIVMSSSPSYSTVGAYYSSTSSSPPLTISSIDDLLQTHTIYAAVCPSYFAVIDRMQSVLVGMPTNSMSGRNSSRGGLGVGSEPPASVKNEPFFHPTTFLMPPPPPPPESYDIFRIARYMTAVEGQYTPLAELLTNITEGGVAQCDLLHALLSSPHLFELLRLLPATTITGGEGDLETLTSPAIYSTHLPKSSCKAPLEADSSLVVAPSSSAADEIVGSPRLIGVRYRLDIKCFCPLFVADPTLAKATQFTVNDVNRWYEEVSAARRLASQSRKGAFRDKQWALQRTRAIMMNSAGGSSSCSMSHTSSRSNVGAPLPTADWRVFAHYLYDKLPDTPMETHECATNLFGNAGMAARFNAQKARRDQNADTQSASSDNNNNSINDIIITPLDVAVSGDPYAAQVIPYSTRLLRRFPHLFHVWERGMRGEFIMVQRADVPPPEDAVKQQDENLTEEDILVNMVAIIDGAIGTQKYATIASLAENFDSLRSEDLTGCTHMGTVTRLVPKFLVTAMRKVHGQTVHKYVTSRPKYFRILAGDFAHKDRKLGPGGEREPGETVNIVLVWRTDARP